MSHHAAESKQPSLSLAERGYQNLVSAICDQEPRCGFTSTSDLPELTDLEVATVVRHHADDLLPNAVVGLGERVAALLTHPSRLELIGAEILSALRQEARARLLSDVQEECALRELQVDDEGRMRESAESRFGVASLFHGSHR